ncbi:complex I subunit 5 family protein [Nocardioides sp. DS6]|uniref:Complex I subunit 5 family protein n=1 Tax=Nocardioides eburneus TaxID=3231482 RepID=A0ABV3T2D9_9ACTN
MSAPDGLVEQLPVLLVVVPLGAGALVAALGHWAPRILADALAVLVAAVCTVGAGRLVVAVGGGRVVTWLGGWTPASSGSGPGGGQSVGIVLVADRTAAMLVVSAALLVLAGLLFSWRYLEETSATYHALMLVFLAALSGFALAGDLFDAFVWFELMGAAAYALAGMRVEEPRSVFAAVEFGVVNTLGASLTLAGITLLYARTGELALAYVGERLRSQPADALVGFAFVLLVVGALVKAAVVPFHFWTADAEAAAPTPVCAVLSGAMVAMGVYAVARWWRVAFDGVLPHPTAEHLLLVLGAVTALVGAVMCVYQRHIKRLLAYSTISHVGVALLGVGLLDEHGTAAAIAYLVGHACTKGPLFLGSGVLLNRYGTVDEHALFGQGRGRWFTFSVFALGGLGLAGLPVLGLWWGKATLEHALSVAGAPWAVAVVVVAGALTSGSVLRLTARVFLGLGADPRSRSSRDGDGSEEPEEPEEPEEHGPIGPRAAALMVAPAWLLLAAGVGLALVPWVHRAGATAGAVFADRHGYVEAVQHPHRVLAPVVGHEETVWTGTGLGLAAVTLALACLVAAAALWAPRVRALPWGRAGARAARSVVGGLHAVHRADLPEQVAWLLAGAAVLAVVFAL